MKVLGISGSASKKGSNFQLLEAIGEILTTQNELQIVDYLSDFELFTPEKLTDNIPDNIQQLFTSISTADIIVISTPEYTHNIPAVLKNMIDWCTKSGVFYQKKVLPITFTPAAPRGEHAMQSLLNSLKALDAQILPHLSLYKTEVKIADQRVTLPLEIKEMITLGLGLD